MKPVVSVIIPCYNHAHYLQYAEQSVLAQTSTDWEAIIVDDGSTDNTREVAERFADPRVRYIYQENRGLSAARNTGISAAQGRFLAFLDADDEWDPRFIQRTTEVLDADESLGGVYTLNRFIDQNGNLLPSVGGCIVPRGEFRARNFQGGFFPPAAILIRASVCQQVGMFDTTLTSEEDLDLWLRMSERYQLEGIAEPLAHYRVYPNSMSTNAGRMHENRIRILTKHFGPPKGDIQTWPQDKRQAYGFALRATAFGFVAQREPDVGWRHLIQAVSTWPDLLRRLDTFYELALGDQPRGYRGQAEMLDITANAAEMLGRLKVLFADIPSTVQALRGAAFGNAYLALAMLSDQAGDWSAARRYLLQAARHNPRLLSGSFLRRLFKLTLGPSSVRWIKFIGAGSAARHTGGIDE